MLLEWVEVPGGTAVFGTRAADVPAVVEAHSDLGLPASWIWKETPQQGAHVPEFRIARVPVTAREFRAFCDATSREAPRASHPEHPATAISHDLAVAYCAWLSQMSGMAIGLPTELQWERAARGSDGRLYPWGDTFEPTWCNLAERGIDGPQPVGVDPSGASPFGCLDMAGNVDEWTSTKFAPYPGAAPTVPTTESWALDPHVTRGGAWYHHRDLARCARRHGVYHRLDGVGFRVATSSRT